MTYEEVKEVVEEISKLHMPEWKDHGVKEKIESLEDHLLVTARGRGILEEARLGLEDVYEEIDTKWRALEGWEMYLRNKPKSQVEIDDAKAQADPELHAERRLCIKLLRQVGNQIRRLERDDAAASRIYTMLTGS
jgi:hypothetical protein